MEIAAGINTGPCGVILLGDLPGEGKSRPSTCFLPS